MDAHLAMLRAKRRAADKVEREHRARVRRSQQLLNTAKQIEQKAKQMLKPTTTQENQP